MSGAKLAQALSVFDDAAIAALASKGLLRRARGDVEKDLADLVELEDGNAVVQADGEEVRIDARGPAAATCSCPATGICRHILAAVMVIQAAVSEAPKAGDGPADRDAGDAEPADPAAEICALSLTEIEKWAGKAAMRAAREMLAESAAAGISREGAAIIVRLNPDTPEIRYLGGLGLDGMVSKISKAKRKALHAAAILAVRQTEGIADGQENRIAQVDAVALLPDKDFLAAVERCLADCVRTGFNQAPAVLEERLFALSVATRADALPRLSRLLRTISAHMRSKRERDFSLDNDAYLSRVAEAFALIRALQDDDAGAASGRLDRLAGLVRQDYADAGDLELYGAGAQVWRTAAGARGVTGYFYAPGKDAWYSASLARNSGQDPTFQPSHAYRTQALWSAGSLDSLSRGKIVLENITASDEGRLSLSETVKCQPAPWSVGRSHVESWPACNRNWLALQSRLVDLFPPSLVNGRSAPCPVLLAPSRCGAAYFDDVAQEIVWPVCDDEGEWIGLTVPHGTGNDQVTKHLEALSKSRSVWAISVLAIAERGRFVLRPFAVWTGEGTSALFNLGLDENAMRRDKPLRGTERIRGLFRGAVSTTGLDRQRFHAAMPNSATVRTLREAFDSCLAIAELGRQDIEPELKQRMLQLADRCELIGLAPCESALKRVAEADRAMLSHRMLAAVYVINCMQMMLRPLPWLHSA